MQLKALVLGAYNEGTGWGNDCIGIIRSLLASDFEVATRPLIYNHTMRHTNEFSELEKNKFREVDLTINCNLPNHFVGRKEKCGVLFQRIFTENTINYADWSTQIKFADTVICGSEYTKKTLNLHDSHVLQTPVEITNVTPDKISPDFLFYTICENNPRKNIEALLLAFHTEFEPTEPVNLLLKCPMDLKPIYDKLNLSVAKGIIHINEYIPDTEIARIHSSCDCFVLPSHGEGVCIPAIEALLYGKTPIVTGYSSFVDYIDNECGWLIEYLEEPVLGMKEHCYHQLYNSRETWAMPSISSLRKCMREAYQNKEARNKKSLAGKEKAHLFSYKNAGNKLREIYEKVSSSDGRVNRKGSSEEV